MPFIHKSHNLASQSFSFISAQIPSKALLGGIATIHFAGRAACFQMSFCSAVVQSKRNVEQRIVAPGRRATWPGRRLKFEVTVRFKAKIMS